MAASNGSQSDQLIVTGPTNIRSTCAHHPMPIHGGTHIVVLPSVDGVIVGPPKYDRTVHDLNSRLRIQEELVARIGQFIMQKTVPRGVGLADTGRRGVEPVPSPAATRCGAAKAKEYGW